MNGILKPNDLLRQQRLNRGWSQQRVADELQSLGGGADSKLVGRWERGEVRPRPFYQESLCKLFTASARDLGFVDNDLSRHGPTAAAGSLLLQQEVGGNMTKHFDKSRRELLIQSTLGIASVSLVHPQSMDTLERLANALSRPSSLDKVTLSHLESQMDGYWKLLPDLIGSSSHALLQIIEGQVKTVTQFLDHPQPTYVERRLWTIIGELSQIAGQMAFDMHDHQLAQAYYKASILSAQSAGNDALLSVAYTRMSFLPTYDGRPQDALSYQQEAHRIAAKNTTPTTAAWIAAVEAEAYAHLGDFNQCQRALERAEAADLSSSIVGTDDPYRTGFGLVKRDGYKGACYIKLHQPEKALRALQSALISVDPTKIRYQSILLTDMASAYNIHGEVVEACSYAGKALALTNQTKSANVLKRIRDFRASVPASQATRVLDEQLIYM